ncbi:MAG: hypothetical protein RLZZ401_2397 [Pseudomonadota bacterium]|jgi:DNA transformation protein
MTTTPAFANYCCELLATVGPCRPKRMFGGFGISTEGLTIALIADLDGSGERLYLKADDASRAHFEAAGCRRFTYQAQGKLMQMNYYSAPDEALDSPDGMQAWAQLALTAALKARKPARKSARG